MSLQACPNAQQIAADAGRRAREFAMWAVLLALASGGCLVASGSPVLPIAAFGCLAVLLAIWHSPKFGVLLLFAGALILECDDSHYPRSVARGALMPVINVHILPFFRPTHEFVKPLHGFFLSPAEICMILIPAICLLQAVYARRFRFERGPFWPLFAILLACWMVGVVNGAATGGDLRLTFLVELRGQSYGIILYLLTYNLLTRRRDLDTLGWMILIGCGIRSIECLLLYFVTFHRDVSWYNTGACLLEHHESFLFNGYFFYTLLLFVTGGPKAQKHVALWLLPIVVVANVLNHRRASTAAAVVTLLALLPLLYAVFREKRASLLRMIAAGAVCTTLYVGLLWNSNSVIAQPIQAIRSQFTPSARDESSD
ncbi:MAG TPA: hypothetical protein VGR43_00545, partial [Dehalococcoidia bacterium]|nr:hypothetical protein [Dehalococcoidia bacterium]